MILNNAIRLLLLFIVALGLAACSDSPFAINNVIKPISQGASKTKIDYTRTLSGDYFANVHYKNPKSDYTGYYELKVTIEDNKLVTIYFPKGGQLDTDHFESPEMENKGEFRFTDDRGREFEVSLICEFDQYCGVTNDWFSLNEEYDSKDYLNYPQ